MAFLFIQLFIFLTFFSCYVLFLVITFLHPDNVAVAADAAAAAKTYIA